MSTQLSAGQEIRAFRKRQRPEMTLEDLADQVKKLTRKRPSTAKLSRIENGKQPVPVSLVGPLARITEIPASKLRRDHAEIFEAA